MTTSPSALNGGKAPLIGPNDGQRPTGLIRRLVIGLGASSAQATACTWAARWATVLNAEVIAAHAIEPLAQSKTPSEARRADIEVERAWRLRLDGWCLPIRATGVHCTIAIARGRAPGVLARVADDAHADAIILGVSRHRRFLSTLGDETARKLRAAAQRPIIIVPSDATTDPSRSLQVVVDIGVPDADHPELIWAAGLTAAAGGQLHVVHTIDPAAKCIRELGVKGLTARFDHTRRSLEADVHRAAGHDGVDAHVDVLIGRPPGVLLTAIERLNADLLVVGSPPAKGRLARVLERHRERDLTRMSRCAVAVVPPGWVGACGCDA
ncbi:MAG: universal stress protein [Candidatus Dormibacteraeota bacterium]|nr:universal stress protein [Candidatus Dormibacteraeota bacterium]